MQLNRISRALVCSVVWSTFVACASVDPKPFERFFASTSEFQKGADEALKETHDLAKAGFAEPSPFDNEVTFDSVVLTFDDDPTRPGMEASPLYAQLRDLRRGAFDLNGAMVEYTRYLSLLAGGSGKDAEELEALAKAANANLRSARDATGIDLGDREVALIATIGVEALRQKIERDRRSYLRETMDGAAPTIDEFSGFMVDTMNLVATDVMLVYAEWAEQQRLAHSGAGGAQRKQEVIMEVLQRNDETLLLLESIRTLRMGYQNLPAAHREVQESLEEGEPLLAAVTRLYGDARRLQKLQQELEKARS